MRPPRFREFCGTPRGLMRHQLGNERLCSSCARSELVRSVELERGNGRLTPAVLPLVDPVALADSDEETAQRRQVLGEAS